MDNEESGWGLLNVDMWTAANAAAGKSIGKEKGRQPGHRRAHAIDTFSDDYLFRNAFSEQALFDAVGVQPPREGQSWHVITGGDIDQICYLQLMSRWSPIQHAILSTWVISASEVLKLKELLLMDKIRRLDMYVGEIFPNQYKAEWGMVVELYNTLGAERFGRLVVFRNHAKVIAADSGAAAYVVEGSANCTQNPRNEQACITANRDLYNFYKKYFDNINSFINLNRDELRHKQNQVGCDESH